MSGERDIVAIGGSAGAFEVLTRIVATLPADFGAAVLLVLHIGPGPRSSLARILGRAGRLPAEFARDGEAIERGRIYIAPPDHHLLVSDTGSLRLWRGPREHFTRPAIDPLFRSAAAQAGPRVIGVVLSGMGRDGGAGLAAIRAAGGLAVVQEPGDAMFPSIPASALKAVGADAVEPAAAIAPLLVRLVSGEAVPASEKRFRLQGEGAPQREEAMAQSDGDFERPAALTCPECGGAVRQEQVEGLTIYRCHTGHRFAAESLATGQLQELERALYIAMRVLNERAELARRMETQVRGAGHGMLAQRWQKARREAEDHAMLVQRFLERDWLELDEEGAAAAGSGA